MMLMALRSHGTAVMLQGCEDKDDEKVAAKAVPPECAQAEVEKCMDAAGQADCAGWQASINCYQSCCSSQTYRQDGVLFVQDDGKVVSSLFKMQAEGPPSQGGKNCASITDPCA